MFMSRHQTRGQKHYIKVANRHFENVAELKYLGANVTNEYRIYENLIAD
jgi:hypothetical protein